MSVFTIDLRRLLGTGFDIGLRDYPIWDEDYRGILNQKLIDHYYMYEIGAETPELFKFYLNRTMNEIMPYYNELYKTTLYKYDPTNAYNLKEEFNRLYNSDEEGSSQGNSKTVGTGEGKTKNLYSDTPQGMMATGAIENGNYLTNATIASNNTTNNYDNNASESRKYSKKDSDYYTKNTHGNTSPDVAALVRSFRESIVNIDYEIITNEEIAKCFMGLWYEP